MPPAGAGCDSQTKIMCKNKRTSLILIILPISIVLTGTANADSSSDMAYAGNLPSVTWSGARSHIWNDADNWWGGAPSSSCAANIYQRDYEYYCLIDSSVTAVCRYLWLPNKVWGVGDCFLAMTGGSLVVDCNLEMGCTINEQEAFRDTGILDISGGAVTVGGQLNVGVNGNGTINMTGGTVNVKQALNIPKSPGGRGAINLAYGTVEASSISMNANGIVDISRGMLIIDGNVVIAINDYVNEGWITAYGGDGNVLVDYNNVNAGKTTVSAEISIAWNPNPGDRAKDTNSLTTLSWSAADKAVTHDVYLGTDYKTVKNASTTTSGAYKGNYGSTTYNVGGFDLGQTCYWRVDEVHDTNTWKGNVWKFTVSDHFVVDDFESYTDTNNLRLAWISGVDGNNNTASTIFFLGTEFFEHRQGGKQSMVYEFDNNDQPYCSEVCRLYNPADDWTKSAAEFLTLFFHGTMDNNTEQMYVVLVDDNNVGATVLYDGDANNLIQQQAEYWNLWNIKLQDFSDGGVDLSCVKKIIIGFGGKNSSGTVYFDDIGLYSSRCAADYEYLPDTDFSRQAILELLDYAKLAVAWLCSANEVHIMVDANIIQGNISKMLTGLNMAYCYDKDQLWADGSIAGYLSDARASLLRYPGGGKTSYFHWMQSYAPWKVDLWDPNVSEDDYVADDSHMNTDEYIRQCRIVGAEPLLGVNIQSGKRYNRIADSIRQASDWLWYCNFINDYNVRYWYLDNEPYYGHNAAMTVQEYADYVNQFSAAMKAIDPNIKLIANWHNELSEPNYWAQWEYLLDKAGNSFDYADVHWYWDWGRADWNVWLEQNPMQVREWCADCSGPDNRYHGPSYVDEIKRFHEKVNDINGISYEVKLVCLEWNVAPVWNRGLSRFQQAMIQAEMLGQYIEGGLYMATMWPLTWDGYLDRNFRTILDQQNHEPTPSYHLFKLYSNALGQQLVAGQTDQAHVRAVSVLSRDGNTLRVYLLNKSADGQPANAVVDVNGFTPDRAEAIALTTADLSSDVAGLQKLKVRVNLETGKWESVLPPYSLTMLTFRK